MSLKRRSPKGEGKSNLNIPNLTNGEEYEGRLVYIADLGMHINAYKGEIKPDVQKLALGIEILGQSFEDEEGNTLPRLLWTKPFNIFHTLTEKGKELEYYKIFDGTAQPNVVADWDAQLDKPVSVTILHVKKDDAVYDNIANLAAIPVKYQKNVEASTITPAIGDVDDDENAATKALYGLTRWMVERRITEQQEVAGEDYEDDIPF